MSEELDPISPAAAKEMCLEARKREVSQSLLDGYHRRLHAVRWHESLDTPEEEPLSRSRCWRRTRDAFD